MAIFGNRANTGTTTTHAGHGAHLWPTVALAFLSWIVLLAGLSSVQDECRANQTQFSDSVRGFLNANSICSSRFRFAWWVLWLSFAVILATAALTMVGHLARGRAALIGFLSFTAVLLVLQTDAFLGAHDTTSSARITTTFVGFLLTTIFTLGLMISVGTVGGHDGEGFNRGTTATTAKV